MCEYLVRSYVVGETGIIDELKRVNIECYGVEDNNKEFSNANLSQLYEDVGAVIVGLDTKINYLKMSKADQYLRLKNAQDQYVNEFIATNPDETFPYNDNKIIPGAGMLRRLRSFVRQYFELHQQVGREVSRHHYWKTEQPHDPDDPAGRLL